jgi:hypothetical protein
MSLMSRRNALTEIVGMIGSMEICKGWVLTMATASSQTIKIFLISSEKDNALKRELVIHLTALLHANEISLTGEREVHPDRDWTKIVNSDLSSVDIILLLLSPDLLSSGYCFGAEMGQVLERNDAGRVRLIPIMLRWTDLTGTSLSKFQLLPGKEADAWKPVIAWSDRDEVWQKIVTALRNVIAEIRSRR